MINEKIDQEVLNNFQMPEVKFGQIVAWYPPSMNRSHAETATVIKVAGRNIRVATATRGIRESVRHIDDPKLRLNADQRETGAWDYTEAEKAQRLEMQKLRDEVSSLKNQINGLVQESLKKQAGNSRRGEGLSKYRELRQKVLDAGIEFSGNPSTEWLEGQLKDLAEV